MRKSTRYIVLAIAGVVVLSTYGKTLKVNGDTTNVEKEVHGQKTEDEKPTRSKRVIETPMTKVGYEEKENEYLIKLSYGDNSYSQEMVELSDSDRELAERIVMAEAGGEGPNGASLVAQCLRDTMVYKKLGSIEEVYNKYSYAEDLSAEPNEISKKAVEYIFNGGSAVNHRVMYFYSPSNTNSQFHESMNFVLQWGGHRFFDEW